MQGINTLTQHHAEACLPYSRILNGAWAGLRQAERLADVPFLPVSLFKTHLLKSVPSDQVRMTMTSSGTTGQAVSQIALDSYTSTLQQRGLAHCLSHILGKKRLPMLVIDTADVFKDSSKMSARGAGVLGLMRFGRDHCFALNSEMEPCIDRVRDFLLKYKDETFFLFGFTYVVWLNFYKTLCKEGLDLSKAILIHSGGWKKMEEERVDNEVFREAFARDFRLTRIYNFYGMVEQLGTLCVEGPDRLLYPPNFADIIIRCPETWRSQPVGEPGLVQILSLLPHSYPGHSLLTEDVGVIESIDPARDGMMGKGVRIMGRVEKAELRGCSDVAAQSVVT